MKRYLILFAFILFYSCDKDHSVEIPTPVKAWNVESLNEEYYIQFPESYLGAGFSGDCFYKGNRVNDLLINQCECDFSLSSRCIGERLATPIPDDIAILPSMVSS